MNSEIINRSEKKLLIKMKYIGVGFLALFLGVFLDIHFLESPFIIAYIPFIILAGFFSRFVMTLAIISGVTTYLLYLHSLADYWTVQLFFFRWLNYFLIAFVIKTLIGKIQNEREQVVILTSILAESLDARDQYTSFHSQNVAYYSREIAQALGMSAEECNQVFIGGLLHDMGKIGVPEKILKKPSKLTDEEFDMIKKHPHIGSNMLKHVPYFRKNGILDMILYHHERYDGKGYPRALKGEEIPFVARIITVADCFDAMTSGRIYREVVGLDYALNEIQRNKGTQFDPKVVEVFLDLIEKGEIEVLGLRNLDKSFIPDFPGG